MKERNIREQIAQDICTACGKINPDECECCAVRINLTSLTDKVCQSFKEEVEKVKEGYKVHQNHLVHDDSKCIAGPLSAPCAYDYCIKTNGLLACPCDSVECDVDCPGCLVNEACDRILKRLEGDDGTH